MTEATPARLRAVHERLADLNAQLGGLIIEHARLLLTYEELAAGGAEDTAAGAAAPPDDEASTVPAWPAIDDATARADRIAYVRTMRRSMLRVLYVVDFLLVHARIDRAMLHDAREALVDGVDAAAAHLMLDDADDDR